MDCSSNEQAPILRRSRAFSGFVPVEEVPGGVTLPPSLPPPTFTPAAFEAQLASLKDRFLARGAQPLTPAACPERRCAGPVAQQTWESYLFDLSYAAPRLRDVRREAETLPLGTPLPTCPAGTPYTLPSSRASISASSSGCRGAWDRCRVR